MMGFVLSVILSLGSINALIPIVLIVLLVVAAAGINRGYSLFSIFGIATLAGINPGGKSSIAGKSAFHVIVFTFMKNLEPTTNLGRRIASRGKELAKAATNRMGGIPGLRRISKVGIPAGILTNSVVSELKGGKVPPSGKAVPTATGFAVAPAARPKSAKPTGATGAAGTATAAGTKKVPGAAYNINKESVQRAKVRASSMLNKLRHPILTGKAQAKTEWQNAKTVGRRLRNVADIHTKPEVAGGKSLIRAAAQASLAGVLKIPKAIVHPVETIKGKGKKKREEKQEEYDKLSKDPTVGAWKVARAKRELNDAKGIVGRVKSGATKVGQEVQALPVVGIGARAVARAAGEAKRVSQSDKLVGFRLPGSGHAVSLIPIAGYRREFQKLSRKLSPQHSAKDTSNAVKTVGFLLLPGLALAGRAHKTAQKYKESYDDVKGTGKGAARYDKAREAARNTAAEFMAEKGITAGPGGAVTFTKAQERELKRRIRDTLIGKAKFGGKFGGSKEHGALYDEVEGYKPPVRKRTIVGATIFAVAAGISDTYKGATERSVEGRAAGGGLKGAAAGLKGSVTRGARKFGSIDKDSRSPESARVFKEGFGAPVAGMVRAGRDVHDVALGIAAGWRRRRVRDEVSERRSGNNENLLPREKGSGETRPERSGYVERSVMAQKERRAKATTNTRTLDTQMGETEKVIDSTHAKIEHNIGDLRNTLIPAAQVSRTQHLDAVKDADAAKQMFATTASALSQAEKAHNSATKDAAKAVNGLDAATANHNAAQAALAKNPTDPAAQAAAAKAKLALDGAITIKLAADATLAATATVLGASQVANDVARRDAINKERFAEEKARQAQAREAQVAGVQRESKALLGRLDMHENLKAAIAGNVNLSRDVREANAPTTKESRDKLKNDLDAAKARVKDAQGALEGLSSEQKVTMEQEYQQVIAEQTYLIQTLEAELKIQTASLEARAQEAKIAGKGEISDFLKDPEPTVQQAALKNNALSNDDVAKANLAQLLTLSLSDDDSTRGLAAGVVRQHLRKATYDRNTIHTDIDNAETRAIAAAIAERAATPAADTAKIAVLNTRIAEISNRADHLRDEADRATGDY